MAFNIGKPEDKKTFDARIKRDADGVPEKAVCGRSRALPGKDCPGMLGRIRTDYGSQQRVSSTKEQIRRWKERERWILDRMAAGEIPEEASIYLSHEFGYAPDDVIDDGYQVVNPVKTSDGKLRRRTHVERGGSDVPLAVNRPNRRSRIDHNDLARHRMNKDQGDRPKHKRRGVIGHTPKIPTTVRCPACGHPNRISLSDS
jgi:hypothetical protein